MQTARAPRVRQEGDAVKQAVSRAQSMDQDGCVSDGPTDRVLLQRHVGHGIGSYVIVVLVGCY